MSYHAKIGGAVALSLMISSASISLPATAAPSTASASKQCDVGFSKGAKIGAVAGVVIGIVAGQIFGKKGHKTETSIAMAGVTGGLGALLGKDMDKKACEKAKQAMTLALTTGKSQTVPVQLGDNQQGQYSYIIDKTYSRSTQASIPVLQGRAVETANTAPLSGVYKVVSVANIRSKPSAASGSTMFETLPVNKQMVAMASTPDKKWLLMSSTGRAAEGWVPAASLSLTSMDQTQFMAMNKESRPVSVVTVAMKQTCRDGHALAITDKEKATGAKESRCMNSNGQWVTV